MELTGVYHIHVRSSESPTDTSKNSHVPRAGQQRISVVPVCEFSQALPAAHHTGLGFGIYRLSVHRKGVEGGKGWGGEEASGYPRSYKGKSHSTAPRFCLIPSPLPEPQVHLLGECLD